ncbi:MAG: SulP family inorganic anion transporter [Rubrivivax sp.]|nr:SulP family inorganic anion transporter [Rubrivivax sp.]
MQTRGAMEHAGSTAGTGELLRNVLAGLLAAVLLVAIIVSFAALMFPGPLAAGGPVAIWAMLVGSGLSGLWIAARTSLPPQATGIDGPTGAVLVGLTVSAGSAVLAAGGTAAVAVQAAMLALSVASLLCGLLLWGLGAAHRGAWLRFVPYFVVAGFLVATGWLLIAGGVRMTTGRGAAQLLQPWGSAETIRLVVALAVFGVLLGLRRVFSSPLALPLTLIVAWAGGLAALRALGLDGPAHGWMLPSPGELVAWTPADIVDAWRAAGAALWPLLPELVSVAIVAVVSLVTKTASLEVVRKRPADLDTELRANGAGAVAAGLVGGCVGSVQIGASRLIEQAGGTGRSSGIVAALVLLAVALGGIDLLALIPMPLAGGLLMFVGWGFLVQALARPIAMRDVSTVGLALAIAVASVHSGYLVGVLGGVIAACLMFAVGNARVGAVRRHLSRAQYAGPVNRAPQAERHLLEHGESIQLYGLNGYLFFGSAEGVFERVRDDMRGLPAGTVRHVILDFVGVNGADASAGTSFLKLRHLCEAQGATLVFAGMADRIEARLRRERVVGGTGTVAPFAELHDALAWCEDRVLADDGIDVDATDETAGFEAWLQQELGPGVAVSDLLPYLEQRVFDVAQPIYREGEPSDCIDLVAAGRLAVHRTRPDGRLQRLRRTMTHTVIGEMGFFRGLPRSADVACEGPARLYTLSREAYGRLQRERPDLALAFIAFVLRTLADRLGLLGRTVDALRR